MLQYSDMDTCVNRQMYKLFLLFHAIHIFKTLPPDILKVDLLTLSKLSLIYFAKEKVQKSHQ